MTLIAAVIVVVAATTLFTLSIRVKDLPKPDPVSPTQHLEERKARIYENLRRLCNSSIASASFPTSDYPAGRNSNCSRNWRLCWRRLIV